MPKTLIEHDAVALALVREHPWLTGPGRVSDLAARFQQLIALLAAMVASSGRGLRLRRGFWRGVWRDANAVLHALLLDRWVVS
jgi:hypothetical protein